jgi:hypothetical protein
MLFLEFIETFLDPILSNDFGGFLLSLIFIAVVGISFGLLNIPKNVIFTASVVLFLMFIAFGWMPIWIVILLTLGLFVFLLMNIRGGSNV